MIADLDDAALEQIAYPMFVADVDRSRQSIRAGMLRLEPARRRIWFVLVEHGVPAAVANAVAWRCRDRLMAAYRKRVAR